MISEKDILILIPALNEEGRIGEVIEEIRQYAPDAPILVVNDGSSDQTGAISLTAGAVVITHSFNMGVGIALQTGYKYAVRKGYRYVIQLDGDGQHPPCHLRDFLQKLKETEADLIIGSRFLDGKNTCDSIIRRTGNVFFAKLLSILVNEKLTDPTSGYRALKWTVLQFCVQDNYSFEYPDADFLLTLHRAGYRIDEIPVGVRPRVGGQSQHSGLKPVYYMIKMFISIFVILLRKRTG